MRRDLYSIGNGARYQDSPQTSDLQYCALPVIAQDVHSGRVLMLAWMNREALDATLATGRMTYWSRSRQSLWVKGETSGHFQRIISMYFDCDGDSVLCKVEQIGSACHTHRESCFYLAVSEDGRRIRVLDSVNSAD